jgi:hypothetical protein
MGSLPHNAGAYAARRRSEGAATQEVDATKVAAWIEQSRRQTRASAGEELPGDGDGRQLRDRTIFALLWVAMVVASTCPFVGMWYLIELVF